MHKAKIEMVKKQLEETKKIMVHNIDLAILRGKKIEVLKDKSTALKVQSHQFVRQATTLKRKLMWQNITLLLLMIGAALGLLAGSAASLSATGIALYTGIGALLGYGIGMVASEIQQKLNTFSLRQWSHSPSRKITVNSSFKKLKEIIMGKKKEKKPVLKKDETKQKELKQKEAVTLTAQDAALLDQAKADLADFKKTQVEVEEQLIIRGQLLDKLNDQATDLKTDTQKLNEDAHKLERFEEAQNHHLNSILIGMGGMALGAGYGFIMGYSWPLMVVFGVLAGSLTYGLSTFATKIMEKVVGVGDWIKSFSGGLHFSHSPRKTYQPLASQNKAVIHVEPTRSMLPSFGQHRRGYRERQSQVEQAEVGLRPARLSH
ncbi:MAG: hypothetical protein JSR17_04475 [Proteobacteria bacterium]|nr:hypothetical protein [Pseudomonadota bacterium]